MISTITTTTNNNVIASISSALHDSELFGDCMTEFGVLNIKLRFLKTFVLCGKKVHNHTKFQHFLVWIEEKLQERAAWLHGFSEASDAIPMACSFNEFIDSLEEKMDKWYGTMLDCSFTPHSISLTVNEVLDIISSNLGILVDWPEVIDPLKVQLRFLKSLIHFVTKGSIEARKDLLAHSETIAINIAYELFRVSSAEIIFKEDWEQMVSGVLTWLLKIKPIDPQVYEIYTQSLSGSKFSKQLLDGDDLLAMKNFLDSLMSTLAEIICASTQHVNLMKGQLEELYARLGSLKIIFERQNIANFDMEIHKEIANVITDAAISICSIYQPQRDVNFGHRHLLEKFEIVLLKIAETDPQVPRTSSYRFFDCVLERVTELASSESLAKSHFETIRVELASVKSSLGEVVDEHVIFQTLWDRLLEVAFKVERVLDHQVIDPLSISFSPSFDSVLEEIGDIKADVLKVKAKEERSSIYSQPSQKNQHPMRS